MELNKDIRDRVFAAADTLYERAGRTAFPTVDAVRKTAKVNMNDAASGMREWRRAQTAQATPLATSIPESVQQLHGQALTALWQVAQDSANESLRAAQAGWEAERAEAGAINRQLGDAYDAQTEELEAAQRQIMEQQQEITDLLQKLEEARRELVSAQASVERTETRATEIERRASDLKAELDLAHQSAGQARAELEDLRKASTADVETLRSERDQARQEVGKVREEAAALRGQVEAMKEHQQGLVEALRKGQLEEKKRTEE